MTVSTSIFGRETTLDAQGTTTEGIRLARTLDLKKVKQVIVELTPAECRAGYSGGPANVTFTFVDGSSVKIINGFGVGYGGTGPWGIHDILTEDLGLPEEEAKRVFKPWNTKILFQVN